MKILVLIIISIIACPHISQGEEISYSERAGFDTRYPDNNVYIIFKDSKSIMWFGTMFGLIMYDGNNYFKFKYNPEDTNSISNDDVISIFEDSKGFLWFGTYFGGLNRYDRKSGLFTRFLKENNSISHNTVWSICEDKKGVIWAGTENGLCKYENNIWSEVNYGDVKNVSRRVNSLAADDFDNLYIGTFGTGLIISDTKRNTFRIFNGKDTIPYSLKGFYVRSIFGLNGNIYVGMINRGAFMIKSEDIAAGKFNFQHIIQDSGAEGSRKPITIYEFRKYENDKIVSGTNKGIYIYNPAVNSVDSLAKESDNGDESNFISILPEGKDFIWASNYNTGLFKLYYKEKNFIKHLKKDSDGNQIGNIRKFIGAQNKILAAGKNGLFEIEGNKSVYSKLNTYLRNKDIHSMASDRYDNLFIGTSSGIIKINTVSFEKDTLLSGLLINSLLIREDSVLIAGTPNGIKFINAFNLTINKDYQNNPGDSGTVSDNFILSMHADSKGDLWAGTYAGLNLLRKNSEHFIRFRKKINDDKTLINNYVYSFIEQDNKICFGTGGGLSVFDGIRFKNFTNKEGLADQAVYSIVKFRDKIWIATNFVIVIYDPTENTFSVVDEFDEQFNPSAVITENIRDILYGTVKGIIKINAGELTERKYGKEFIFTGITYESDSKQVSKDLTAVSEITIPYDAVNIKLDYSDLNYLYPGTSRYYYSISRIDNEWSYNGSMTGLKIKKLDPDEYSVRFKVVSNNGISYESPSALTINVTPPFYRTIYFYSIVSAVVLLSAISFYKINVRSKIRRVLELEKLKEREREKIRYETSRDYHDELGHKLTRISIYSRNLLREIEEQKENIAKELNKIIETSKSLRESAGDLIWSMDPGEDTLTDLVLRIKDFAETLLQDTDIRLNVTGITEKLKSRHLSMEEKRNILLITKEAVNNSVKYSQSSELKINFDLSENIFSLKISDNGCGFLRNETKEGYGLKSMVSRAEKIKARFSIVSNKALGTTVSLELKLKDTLKEFSVN